MAIIVPAILEDDYDRFLSKKDQIVKIPEVRRIQVDISDGKFTPRKTVDLSEIEVLNPVFEWEAHLMVENPGEYLFDLKLLGFSCAIVHYEAIADKRRLKNLVQEIHELKMAAGLAIRPGTPIEKVLDNAEDFDLILVLAVEPGYQGQVMHAETLARVEKLKKCSKNFIIEVDGGINLNNVRELADAGVNLLVVGSALFAGEATPAENFEKLTLNL